jgi:hypothetical protein
MFAQRPLRWPLSGLWERSLASSLYLKSLPWTLPTLSSGFVMGNLLHDCHVPPNSDSIELTGQQTNYGKLWVPVSLLPVRSPPTLPFMQTIRHPLNKLLFRPWTIADGNPGLSFGNEKQNTFSVFSVMGRRPVWLWLSPDWTRWCGTGQGEPTTMSEMSLSALGLQTPKRASCVVSCKCTFNRLIPYVVMGIEGNYQGLNMWHLRWL